MKNLYSAAALLAVLSFSGATLSYANGNAKDTIPSYMDQAINKLPKDDAEQFRDTMKEAHEKNVAISDKIHELHDEIDDIVAAETFDESAFRAKSKELRDVYETMRSNTDDSFASAIAQLPQDERKILVTAMAYPNEKHKGKNKAQ